MAAVEPISDDEFNMAAALRDDLALEMIKEGADPEYAVRVAEIRLMVSGYRYAVEHTAGEMTDDIEEFLDGQ